MRTALAAFAVCLALASPVGAAAQAEVLVFLEAESPLRPLLAVELSGRGWRATFAEPVAAPARHTVEAGVIGSLWLEPGPAGGVILRAFRTDRGTSSRLSVSAAAAADVGMLCLVAASLLEELLTHQEVLLPSEEAAEVPEAPRVFPPRVWFYLGTDLGTWIRLSNTPDLHVSARLSVGLQLAAGFRIGAVTSVEGHREGVLREDRALVVWGLEAGARYSLDILSVHLGVQILGGVGPTRDATSGSHALGIFAGYVGVGVWAGRRVDLSFRVTGEARVEKDWHEDAVLRLSLRGEFR